jgi:hypothetical protein
MTEACRREKTRKVLNPEAPALSRCKFASFEHVATMPGLWYEILGRSFGAPFDEKNNSNAWKSSATRQGGAAELESEAHFRQEPR